MNESVSKAINKAQKTIHAVICYDKELTLN